MHPEKPSGRTGEPPPRAPAPARIVPAGFWAGPRIGQCRAISNPNACPARRGGSESTQAALLSIRDGARPPE